MTYPEGNAPQELRPGRFHARVIESAVGQTSNGTDQLAIGFELPELGGTRTTAYLYFTDAAIEGTEKSLDALGFDLAGEGYDVALLHGDGSRIVGVECEVVIEWEDSRDGYEGRHRVRWINRLGGGGVALKTRHDEGGVAALSKNLAARFGGGKRPKPRAAGGVRKDSVNPPARPQAEDDEVPF